MVFRNPSKELFNLQMNRETGTGKLSIDTIEDVRVKAHFMKVFQFTSQVSGVYSWA